jgi:hypothetical protein
MSTAGPARDRKPLLCALLLLVPFFSGRAPAPFSAGRELDAPWLQPLPSEEPARLPGPVARREAILVEGERLRARHFGAWVPARAAAHVGAETWLATPSGVLRYGEDLFRDPARARPIGRVDVASGLPAPGVNDLLLETEGAAAGEVVRVATDAGLARVDLRGRAVGPILLEGKRVTALARGLVGTSTGLYLARRTSGLEAVPGGEGLFVTRLLRCGGGEVYVATHDRGLLVLEGEGQLHPVPGAERGRFSALDGCRPGEARVVAASSSGIRLVEGGRARVHPSLVAHAEAALLQGGRVLAGTFGDGVLVDGAGTAALLPGGRVSLLFAGPSGELLVSTDERIAVLGAGPGQVVDLPLEGPPRALVTALLLDRGWLYAGGFDSGLARLHLATGRWERIPLPEDRITTLERGGPKGALFVGTASGLFVLGRDGEVRPVADPLGWLSRHISTLRLERARGLLLVGAHPGLVLLNPAREPFSVRYFGARGAQADAGLAGPTVFGAAWSARGIVVGTTSGLSLLGPCATRSITDLFEELPENVLNDVRTSGDEVHLLTLRSGLVSFGPRGTRIVLAPLMTSPSSLVVEPGGGGRLLFGTSSRGVAVLEPEGASSAAAPRVRTFGPRQGLSSALVAALEPDPASDRLFVGGSGGIDLVENASRALAPKDPTKETSP